MVRMKVLNIYKLNIYQILNFMLKIIRSMCFQKPNLNTVKQNRLFHQEDQDCGTHY